MNNPFRIDELASLGFGQLGQLLDGMDLMSRTWSKVSMPSAMSPALSLEDLDKRIADLRAIEQWLALNQNMLRTTIQGLEVQRGTVAALQSLGKVLDPALAGAALFDAARQATAPEATRQEPVASRPAAPAAPPPPPAAGKGPDAPAAAPQRAGTSGAAAGAADEPAPQADAAASGDSAQLAQAWWDMLNRNFQQVAQTALGSLAAATQTTAPRADADADAATTTGRKAAGSSGPAGATGRKRGARKGTPAAD